ncbi:protein FAM193B-like [Balaenoptera acutorostrata]|uniref:Protein FAM193B-like n=1 Tax=Balaenoptera acutorostrata TaxID=9767 RepID=A0A384B5A5_BALAC|nr:protein FAM193B-like [Balaenoptera acutorostrata]
MNLLLLAVGLTLLRCPQALHWGPQDPNFNETLVSGEWFLAGLASNQPKLLREDEDARLLIHRIQVTPRALQLHLRRKVNGACVPITMTANKTKRKFQYLLESKYRPAILQPHPPGPAPPPVRGRAWPGAQLPGRPPRDGVPGLGAAPPWHRQQWRARVGGGFREGPEAHTRSCPARGPASPQERVIRPCDGTRGIPGSGSCPPPTLTPGVTDAAQNRVFLGKADPKSYIILCNHREKREEVVAVSLLSRTPEASPDALLMFTDYCRNHGIHTTKIINVTRTGVSPRHRRTGRSRLTQGALQLPHPLGAASALLEACPAASNKRLPRTQCALGGLSPNTSLASASMVTGSCPVTTGDGDPPGDTKLALEKLLGVHRDAVQSAKLGVAEALGADTVAGQAAEDVSYPPRAATAWAVPLATAAPGQGALSGGQEFPEAMSWARLGRVAPRLASAQDEGEGAAGSLSQRKGPPTSTAGTRPHPSTQAALPPPSLPALALAPPGAPPPPPEARVPTHVRSPCLLHALILGQHPPPVHPTDGLGPSGPGHGLRVSSLTPTSLQHKPLSPLSHRPPPPYSGKGLAPLASSSDSTPSTLGCGGHLG